MGLCDSLTKIILLLFFCFVLFCLLDGHSECCWHTNGSGVVHELPLALPNLMEISISSPNAFFVLDFSFFFFLLLR